MATQEQARPRLRVYILSVFLFSCLIAGGVCLGLSITISSFPWLANAGIALVGIPWLFWVSVYIYSCFKGSSEDNNQGRGTKAMAPTTNTKKPDDEGDNEVDDINRVHETQDDLAKRVESLSIDPEIMR